MRAAQDGLLALDRVDFELRRGEIVGYLGPNGSGKTTTVNLVVGLLEPSAGSLSLNGQSLADDPIAPATPITIGSASDWSGPGRVSQPSRSASPANATVAYRLIPEA